MISIPITVNSNFKTTRSNKCNSRSQYYLFLDKPNANAANKSINYSIANPFVRINATCIEIRA